ncbi:hypothetical protein, partial [Acinetobacter sp. Ver3]|uniref:hypothetical protein n=1 Tax=Acinetobacter sp. Ver3 TaxID=466088 RepID=UPI001BB2D15B
FSYEDINLCMGPSQTCLPVLDCQHTAKASIDCELFACAILDVPNIVAATANDKHISLFNIFIPLI